MLAIKAEESLNGKTYKNLVMGGSNIQKMKSFVYSWGFIILFMNTTESSIRFILQVTEKLYL